MCANGMLAHRSSIMHHESCGLQVEREKHYAEEHAIFRHFREMHCQVPKYGTIINSFDQFVMIYLRKTMNSIYLLAK